MRRKSSDRKSRSLKDSINDFESETLRPPRPASPVVNRPPLRPIPGTSDRRRWDPTSLDRRPREEVRDTLGRPARIVHGRVARQNPKHGSRVIRKKAPLYSAAVHKIGDARSFRDIAKTTICLQRKIRRNVLFALKRHKKGSGSPRRRNEYSNIRC